jgi:ketosteroid isomerase-like protein
MSVENVAAVHDLWAAFLRSDAEGARARLDADVEWDGRNLPDGSVARGLDHVADHIRRWADMWETWEVELEDVIDAGEDRMIVFFHERGRSKAGVDVNERHSELYVVKGGEIVYRKGFSDAGEALAAAGLS